jgi:predicted enzyme related to lactoylglutathione lyase
MITRVHSTTIVVRDQDKALDFYVNTLGWTKSIDNQMGPEMRFLTVVPPGGGAEVAIGQPGWLGREPGGETGISLISDDIDGDYERLFAAGVTFTQPVEAMPWGGKGTHFQDPDGNAFFLADEPK